MNMETATITTSTGTGKTKSNMSTTTTTRSVKISFQGLSRDVKVPAQATLAILQSVISSTFKVDLPARSGSEEAAKDSDLRFTYKDPDGDTIVFDTDAELMLALRLCPNALEISAAGKIWMNPIKQDHEYKLFKVAARNLREYNGVPSMTPIKLTKTLKFLKLNPRRLVKQDLAPEALLAEMKGQRKRPGRSLVDNDNNNNNNNSGILGSVASGVEAMRVDDDDNKEWDDGFVSVESVSTVTAVPATMSDASDNGNGAPTNKPSCDAEEDSPATTEEDDDAEEEEDADADATGAGKGPVYKAFIAGGIELLPREVWPLLVALGVRPRRLVKLGLVDAGLLRRMACLHKMAYNKKQRMARGGGLLGGSAFGSWDPIGLWASPFGPDGQVMRSGGWGSGGYCGRRHPGAPRVGGKMGKKLGGGKQSLGRMVMPHPAYPFAYPPPPPPPARQEDDVEGEEEEEDYVASFAPANPAGGGGRPGPHRHPHHGHHHGHHHGPPHHLHPHPGHHHGHPPHPHPHFHPHGLEDQEGEPGFYHGPPYPHGYSYYYPYY